MIWFASKLRFAAVYLPAGTQGPLPNLLRKQQATALDRATLEDMKAVGLENIKADALKYLARLDGHCERTAKRIVCATL